MRFSFRSILVVFAILAVILTAVAFSNDIPSRIKKGSIGHEAIKLLDATRRPFLALKQAEFTIISPPQNRKAKEKLLSAIADGKRLLARFLYLADYEHELKLLVQRLSGLFENWATDEKRFFEISGLPREGAENRANMALYHRQLIKVSDGFLATMAALGDAEIPIHETIHNGDSAFKELRLLAGLFITLMITVIMLLIYQRPHELAAMVKQRHADLNKAVKDLENEIAERKPMEKTLKESEKRYRDLITNLPDAVVVHREGKILFVNRAALSLVGAKKPEELLGKNILDFVPPSYLEKVKKRIANVTEGKKAPLSESKLFRLDGNRIDVEVVGIPIEYEGRQSVQVIIRDITAYKVAEKLIEQSEARFRTLFESSSDAIMMLDSKGFFDCNSATLRIFGCESRDQFVGTHPAQWSPAKQPCGTDSMSLAVERINTAFKEGSNRFEWTHKRMDGSEFPAEVWLTAMKLEGREVLQATVRDITEQKADEEKLKKSEEKFKTFLENAADAIIQTDMDGNVILANKKAEELLGYSKEELLNLHFSDIPAPERLDKALQAFQETANKGSLNYSDALVVRKDGRRVPVDIHGNIIESNGRKAAQAIFRDITARKEAEEEAQIHQSQLNTIIDSSSDIIFLKNKDSRYLIANKATEKFFSVRAEYMIGKTDFDLMPAENAVVCRESDKLALQSQDIIQREEYTLNRWLDVVKRAVRDEEGNVTGIVGVIRDITERKAAEDKLKKSEATLEEAQRIGRMGNWELDLTKDELKWSEEIYNIFEMNSGKFKASYEAFLDAIHPDDRDFVNEAYTSSIKSRKPYDIVHRLLLKDGRLKYVNEKGETFYDDNGKPLRSIGTVQDITERKIMEENLARKATAVEQAAESIVITDVEGNIVDVNPQFEKNTGYTKEEAIGRNPRILKSGQHDKRFYKNLWDTITAGKVWMGTFVNKRKDGTLYDEEAVISPVFNEAGKIINYISVKRDVTERKLAEEKLKKSVKTLERFNRLAVGREVRMVEMKGEVNALLKELGRREKYAVDGLKSNSSENRKSDPAP